MSVKSVISGLKNVVKGAQMLSQNVEKAVLSQELIILKGLGDGLNRFVVVR